MRLVSSNNVFGAREEARTLRNILLLVCTAINAV